MTMRIHTGRAEDVAISVLDTDQLVKLYGAEMADVERSLVIEDTGNCEALALMGSDQDFRDLARAIAGRTVVTDPRFEEFYCSCRPVGRERCEAMLAKVLGLLDTDRGHLLTRVVQSLNWDFEAMITALPNDMWSAVVAESHEQTWQTYVQCDELEHGVAGTWLAFYEKFPDRFEPRGAVDV